MSQTSCSWSWWGCWLFFNHNIQFKIGDSPSYKSFENVAIIIGSAAFVIACVYRPPASSSDAFCDEFFNLLEYLSSVSQIFLTCGDFNIHVDTTSKNSEKFLNCLESCNINQHVHKPTHLHGHILGLIITPDDSRVVSNVQVSEFISDHALVLGNLDFTKPSMPISKYVTFRRFHKIKMDSLKSDLASFSFVKCLGNTASVLYEQYTNDLIDLLDKHAPKVSRTFIKGPAKWLSDSYLLAKAVRCQFEWIWRKDKSPQNRARLCKQIACCNSLVNKDKSNYFRNLVSDQDSKKLWQVLRSALHTNPESVQPSDDSHKCLANRFGPFSQTRLPRLGICFPAPTLSDYLLLLTYLNLTPLGHSLI